MKTIGINFGESYLDFFFTKLIDKKDTQYNTIVKVPDQTYKNLALGETLSCLVQDYLTLQDKTFSPSTCAITNINKFNKLFKQAIEEYNNE